MVAGLGGHLDTPDKKEARLRNCLYQISLWVPVGGIFSIAN